MQTKLQFRLWTAFNIQLFLQSMFKTQKLVYSLAWQFGLHSNSSKSNMFDWQLKKILSISRHCSIVSIILHYAPHILLMSFCRLTGEVETSIFSIQMLVGTLWSESTPAALHSCHFKCVDYIRTASIFCLTISLNFLCISKQRQPNWVFTVW